MSCIGWHGAPGQQLTDHRGDGDQVLNSAGWWWPSGHLAGEQQRVAHAGVDHVTTKAQGRGHRCSRGERDKGRGSAAGVVGNQQCPEPRGLAASGDLGPPSLVCWGRLQGYLDLRLTLPESMSARGGDRYVGRCADSETTAASTRDATQAARL